ncbi:hypothetical protein HK097_006135, partial [Rhizophlyctis rosea]
MPGGLFGELELVKSKGHTPVLTPSFITPTVICYASGSCLNFIDIAVHRGDESKEKTEYPPLRAGSPVTAVATFRRESVVAFAEQEGKTVKVVRWPSG